MAQKTDTKYAIIQLGGNQHMVSEGTIFEIERQEKLAIEVLLYSDGKNTVIGDPIVKDVSVKASILEQKRDAKVKVARFKSKSRYRKTKGHKQPISVVKIEEILGKGEKAEKIEKPTNSTKKGTAKPKATKKAPVKAKAKAKKAA